MAEKCVTRELGIKLLDTVDAVRDTVLRETGLPVEHMNPAPMNKEAGLTTLVEKSTGTIRKIGSTPIQGILEYCEQPTGKGVWLPKHDSVWPPTTAIYGSLSGAHLSVLNSGVGSLYFELPHMVCVRMTGNPETYENEDFKLDFNAGLAFEGKTIAEIGEILFDYIIRVAQEDECPKAEEDKIRAFNMYYYTENEFGDGIDRSRILPCIVKKYQEKCKQLTDLVK
jgi:altronate dehydratase large subunit